MSATARLSGIEKAAILLVALGTEPASQILKFMEEEEIEELTTRISNMAAVDPDVRDSVLKEVYQLSSVKMFTRNGGAEYAREILSRALGSQRAQELLERIRIRSKGAPFDFLDEADPAQLANTLKNEHPQTIALIVSHLKAAKAAAILSYLDDDVQGEVASRIAVMDRVSPDVIKKVEEGLKGKSTSLMTQEYAAAGGVQTLVSILHQVDRSTEKIIMDTLDQEHEHLAEEVRQKMFVFENIATLDDRTIQRILRDVDTKDLILALKGASEVVRDLIFRNLSKRAADLLREDLAVIGPVRLRNVEEAQQRIVTVIRQLEQAEEIVISRAGEDDVIM